jgi:hypothetical protein
MIREKLIEYLAAYLRKFQVIFMEAYYYGH